jgi:hypothetical protein
MKGIRTVVVSASDSVKREANKRGVEYIDKGDFENLEDNLITLYDKI